MEPFIYVRADRSEQAIAAAKSRDAHYIAGGTTLVDLMRLDVMQPEVLVDITRLPLDRIEETATGLRIGALARNSTVAAHPAVARYPVLAEALLSGASPQLRNMATVGGNLLQRTRCPYFRDRVSPCNKREPGSGCAAQDGFARSHAVLGTSVHCIATHPSDMCVALLALDAMIHTLGPDGPRSIAVADFHVVPGDHPDVESVLAPGELVTHVVLPATALARHSRYVKVRDRAEFSFALASAAVAVELRGPTIHDARIALGGVATKPWRVREAEQVLIGQPPTPAVFRLAAEAALAGATPRPDNAFKIVLAKRVIAQTLRDVVGAP